MAGFDNFTTTKRVLITSLAGVRVLEEEIPKKTEVDTLKEIIAIASHLAVR